MGDSNELIQVALTAVIALTVGLTSASFGMDSPAVEPSGEATQMRILVDKAIQALSTSWQHTVNDSRQVHPEI